MLPGIYKNDIDQASKELIAKLYDFNFIALLFTLQCTTYMLTIFAALLTNDRPVLKSLSLMLSDVAKLEVMNM